MMLLFSARMGALAQRIGPRLPMTVGPVIAGAGMALFSLLEPGVSYWKGVFPAAMVLAVGLTITVAPLTAAVLAAVEDRHAGLSSAINNAVARIGGLLAIAVLPALAGIAVGGTGVDLDTGFNTAMYIAGGLECGGRRRRLVHHPHRRTACASAPAAISRFRASPSAWRSPHANRRQQTTYSKVC